MSCIYCGGPGPFTDEHVLSRAFVGEGQNLTLIDLVCHRCNTDFFSRCEREWTSFPGLAMSRIYFGPAGRKRKGKSYRVHPGEHIYLIADKDPVAYEAEILDGLQPQVRAQVVGSPGTLLALAADANAGNRLSAAIHGLINDREITAYKHPDLTRGQRYLIAKIGRIAGSPSPCVVGYEWRAKPVKAWLDRFPDKPPRDPFFPRLSVDQDDRLRIRSENLETAIKFFGRVLRQQPSQSGQRSFPAGTYQIALGHDVSIPHVNRAIAKTAFNIAIHVLKEPIMRSAEFDRCRRYCWEGTGDDPKHPFVGWITEDSQISGLPAPFPKKDHTQHVLMLASDGYALVALIQLYGAGAWKVHLGRFTSGTNPFNTYFTVDYNGAGIVVGP